MKQFCKPRFTIFLCSFFCNLIFWGPVSAQSGMLDATFGNFGRVITGYDTSNTKAVGLVTQPDGKIIVASNSSPNHSFYLIRYHTNGAVDSSFGIDGWASTKMGQYSAQCVAIQNDGKIILAGYTTMLSNTNQDFVLARFSSKGIVDSSFGVNGIVTTAFQNINTGQSSEQAKKIIIKPNGKILVGGMLGISNIATTNYIFYPIMAQYQTNGLLDSSFGTNGKVFSDSSTYWDFFTMNLQINGKIIAGQMKRDGNFVPTRYSENGSKDSSFGYNGEGSKIYLFVNNDQLVQSDGKIIFVGNFYIGNRSFIEIVRYNPDGSLDNNFGLSGIVKLDFNNNYDYGKSIQIMPNGKMLIGCSINLSNSPQFTQNYAIIRLNANGTIDNSFGTNGLVTTDFGLNDDCISLALQANNKILLIGNIGFDTSSNLITNYIGIARYDINELPFYNTLKGIAFFDTNKNGTKDADEPFYSSLNIISNRVGKDTLLVNSSSGRFTVYNDTGLNVTTAKPYSIYYTASPSSFTTNHSTYFNTDSISFAVQPTPGKRDIAITVIPLSPARPGFQAVYKMMYTNFGTDTLASGYIGFLKDNRLTYLSASANPLYINGDSIVWSISNLKPMDTGSVIIYCRVQAPPVTNVNDTLHCAGVIYPTTGDLVTGNNVSNLSQRVVGSYDPNSKSENHGGSISISDVASGQYLEYTISFQNTGTDSAFNVYIRDTLDAKLDWSTFAMVATSHNYQLVINDQAKCLWSFNGINLPDSNRNEPASHGFITFIIKPKSNLVVGDIITNKAAIYFDYNLPIITNVEKTRVVSGILPLKLLQFSAIRHGKTNLLQWTTADEQNTDFTIIERSNNGTEFTNIGSVKAGFTSYSFTDYSPPTRRGTTFNYYRLKMIDKDGRFTYSPIRLVNNSSTLEVTLYPNPTKTKLQVNIESDKDATVQYEIISQQGQIQLSSSWTVQEGANSKSFSVTNLPTGQYFLRISLSNKEQSILKFEKL